MSWAVYVAGEIKLLDEIQRVIEGTQGYGSHKGIDGVYLTSDKFEELDDPDKIRKTTEKMISRINLCLKLISETRKPISVTGIGKIKPDGSREIFVGITDGIRFSASATSSITKPDGTVTGDNISTFDHGVLQKIIEIGDADLAVNEAGILLEEQKLDWSTLYKVYEIICNDVGESLYSKGWATKSDIKNFKHTAQSPAAIGTQSRHGIDKYSPPKNPMSMEQAKHLITSIFKNWINSKNKL